MQRSSRFLAKQRQPIDKFFLAIAALAKAAKREAPARK
jgi:hypothetical protein